MTASVAGANRVDWAGPLPAGWCTGRISYFGRVALGKMIQPVQQTADDVAAPYMRAANVQPSGVLTLADVKTMWFHPGELDWLTLKRNDVVVVEGGVGGFGRSAFVPQDLPNMGFQNSINRIRPYAENDGRYLTYCLLSARASGFIHAYSTGVSMPHLTAEKLERITIPLPPPGLQRQIADFLDRETAQIDELIGKQNDVIALLVERRGAAVDRVFLEQGSEHKVPLRYVTEMVTVGIVVTPARWYDEDGEGVLALRGTNVKPDAIVLDDVVRITSEGHLLHRKSILRTGDVVVVRTGQAGAAAVVPDKLDGINAIDLLIARPNNTLLGEYLVMYMNSPSCQTQTTVEQVGSIQGHFNVSSLRSMPIPMLPVREQQRVVEQWKAVAGEIDDLIAKGRQLIALARERRSALITAAVTGKIDVRGAA